MDKFRVWQANRQVFLYPENYIEPELRDDKTELFQALEDELLQQQITDDVGVTALSNYLDEMNEVSNLEIVGVVRRGRQFVGDQLRPARDRPDALAAVHVLLPDVPGEAVVRRQLDALDHDPDRHQRRRGRAGHLQRAPAPLLAVDPPQAEAQAVPRRAARRETRSTGPTSATTAAPSTGAEIRIMWTEFNPSQKKWLKPKRTLATAIDEDAPNPFHDDSGDNVPSTEPYHLRITSVGQDYASLDVIKTSIPQDPEGAEAQAAIAAAQAAKVRGRRASRTRSISHAARHVPVLVYGRGHLHRERRRGSQSRQELSDRHRPDSQRGGRGRLRGRRGRCGQRRAGVQEQRSVLQADAGPVPRLRHQLRLRRYGARTSRSSTRPP